GFTFGPTSLALPSRLPAFPAGLGPPARPTTTTRMTIGQSATESQPSAIGIRGISLRCRAPLRTSTRQFAAATDLGAVHSIALHSAVPGRQSTIVRNRLAFSPTTGARPSIGVLVTQQAQLQHQSRHDGLVQLFPTAATQI